MEFNEVEMYPLEEKGKNVFYLKKNESFFSVFVLDNHN